METYLFGGGGVVQFVNVGIVDLVDVGCSYGSRHYRRRKSYLAAACRFSGPHQDHRGITQKSGYRCRL